MSDADRDRQLPNKQGAPIGRGVRILAGATGSLLLLLAFLNVVLTPEFKWGGVILLSIFGALFLIPSVLSGPQPVSRSDNQQNRLIFNTGLGSRVMISGSTVAWLVCLLHARFVGDVPDPWKLGGLWVVLLWVITIMWCIGVVLQFFYFYYLNQSADGAEG